MNTTETGWKLAARGCRGSESFEHKPNENIELFKIGSPHNRKDVSWMYDINIPKGKTLTFRIKEIRPMTAGGYPQYYPGKILETHFRLSDYRDKNFKQHNDILSGKHHSMYLDPDPDKWINENTFTLEEGEHNFFICPNFEHDLCYMVVEHESEDFKGSYSGYLKTTDFSKFYKVGSRYMPPIEEEIISSI